MKTIFTIGYAAFNIDDFVKVLLVNNIGCIVDVRSMPASKFHIDFNKSVLEKRLFSEGILYRHYAKEFGARQENRQFYTEEGYLDFNKFIVSDSFKLGVNKIVEGMELGYRFCLMCSEADPINCHRSIMIGRAFKNRGFNVEHLLKNNIIETQENIENRLINMYFKDRNQFSMFSVMKSDEQVLREAYAKKNKEIGFRGYEE